MANVCRKTSTRLTERDFSSKFDLHAIIEAYINTVGTAPRGANLQCGHFVVISKPEVNSRIREAAEKEECAFYQHRAPDEWLKALAVKRLGREKTISGNRSLNIRGTTR